MVKTFDRQRHEKELARMDRIIAIRSHAPGVTNTCPQCEEKNEG